MAIDRTQAHEDVPDHRWEAAHKHADGQAVVDRVAGIRRQLLHEQGFEKFMHRQDSHNFIDGYDYAMEHGHAELLAENMALHERLLEIQYDLPSSPEEPCKD